MLKDGPKTFTQTLKEKRKEVADAQPAISSNVDSDGENWIPPPAYHQSFSDAIQAALESVNLQDSTGNMFIEFSCFNLYYVMEKLLLIWF